MHSSPFHLARLFRAVTGESISRYLLRLRLGLALDRMAAGETELARLAVELGCAHHSHFSARFRSVFGTTPTQAREKLASARRRELSTIVTAASAAAPSVPRMSGLQGVKDAYERLGRGDISGLLALFDPQIEWRLAEGHHYSPKGEAWIGAEAVAENFFMRAGGEWDGWTVSTHHFHVAAEVVVVECRYQGCVQPDRQEQDIQVCHVWKVTDGKLKRVQQYIDTARLQEIMRPDTSSSFRTEHDPDSRSDRRRLASAA